MLTEAIVTCIIPARYASTRLPGKPLISVGNKPLVMWAYDNAVKSNAFYEVVVATDDTRIFDAVEEFGGKAVMTSSDHQSGTDRIYEASKELNCTHIVNLQGDEPNIPQDLLRQFAEDVKKLDNFTLKTCVSNCTIEEKNDSSVVKAVLDYKNNALYFSRASIPFNRDGKSEGGYKHLGIYGFSKLSLESFCSFGKGKLEALEKLEQLRALENGMEIECIITEHSGVGIDTDADLEKFKKALELS